MLLTIVGHLGVFLFLAWTGLFVVRTMRRLDDVLPKSPSGGRLASDKYTKEQRDISDAVQVLFVGALVFLVAFVAYGIWVLHHYNPNG